LDEQFAEHALGREEAAISDMLNELNKDISKIHVTANKSKMIIFLHSLTYRTKKSEIRWMLLMLLMIKR